MQSDRDILPADYARLLGEIKERVRTAQYAALRAVNRELVGLYWDIGRTIVGRQEGKSWGKAVVERLAADLRAEFPGVGGFSASNLWRMKAFYEAYAGSEKLAPLVRELAGFRVPAEKKPAWCFDPSTDRLDLSAWQNFKTGARMSAWI